MAQVHTPPFIRPIPQCNTNLVRTYKFCGTFYSIYYSMFLFPLQQAHFRDSRLRKIARRTLLLVLYSFLIAQDCQISIFLRAALVALTTSSINIAILTIKHGEEMGWICLASCGLDVRTSVHSVIQISHLHDLSGDSQCCCPLLGDRLPAR